MPNPDISIADHASQNLYLVSGKNPFPGLVDFTRTPYLLEILEALMPDNGIERVVLMKGWQTGGTLTILSWMLWVMDAAPSAMMIVQPTGELRDKFSKQRINPIIANCHALRDKVFEQERFLSGKSKEKDTLISKVFPGGHISLSTSTSEQSLRSEACQYVAFDEVSAYDEDCQGHGDPCGLALGRTSAYDGRKKIFYNSTPTLKDNCRIEREYLTTDQRKYFVPCLNCGEMQIIVWERIDRTTELPVYRCIRCNYGHIEQDKTAMLRGGEWRPTAKPSDGARGYHLPALYAPPGMWSWKSSVQQYMKGLESPVEMKVFINNCIGEPYTDDNIKVLDPNDLRNLVEDYDAEDLLPKGIGYVTAGVDTHPGHVDIVVMGWGREGERWVLGHFVVQGDSNQALTWQEVYGHLQAVYMHPSGTLLRVAATCVDTGGHNTDAVYKFCKDREHEFIVPIKGSSDRSAPIIKRSLRKDPEVHLFPVGKLATHGRLYSALNKSVAKAIEIKDALKRGVALAYGGPGTIHFYKGLKDSFFKELTAPKPKWVKKGTKAQLSYETTAGVADHAHDCMRYADAAREFMNRNIDAICDGLEAAD
ncbi:MAG TPA: terminase gpA endonuclease subunit [Oligoflexus sp.]|uniref:terminase gpA endonuclease subunit n=1 Tax=Oligoflexus sp. TaxID=1971216 RepID=UPI002D64DDED|nr:terminase gpA endonuclease subunit [Oligoflexus sp.]HYX32596.1 terminase gpA endonuclease subunit [Oligoflexus sp.]